MRRPTLVPSVWEEVLFSVTELLAGLVPTWTNLVLNLSFLCDAPTLRATVLPL